MPSSIAKRPCCRARSGREFVAFVEKHEPGSKAHIYDAFPAESRAIFEATPDTGWVDVKHDRYMTKGIVDTIGPARAEELWIKFIGSHLDTALFRTLIGSMVRLFGLSPATMVKALPRAWGQVYRNVCQLEAVDSKTGYARCVLKQVHPEVMSWPYYYENCWTGIFKGFFRMTGVDGGFVMTPDHERSEIDCTWRWDT